MITQERPRRRCSGDKTSTFLTSFDTTASSMRCNSKQDAERAPTRKRTATVLQPDRYGAIRNGTSDSLGNVSAA